MRYSNLIPILFIFGLLSCPPMDEYSNYQMIIDNNTHDTIEIFFTGKTAYTNGTDSILALPMNQTIYYDERGGTIRTRNFECDPQISKNEVSITTSSNKTLIKDISDKKNWECETDSKNTYWKFIFQIDETDLN